LHSTGLEAGVGFLKRSDLTFPVHVLVYLPSLILVFKSLRLTARPSRMPDFRAVVARQALHQEKQRGGLHDKGQVLDLSWVGRHAFTMGR
jgi:hypothetical protein